MTEHPFVQLRRLLQEAHKLGVRFQLRGADVMIVGADAMQASLRAALEWHRQTGTLWTYLGGDEDEAGPTALLEELDVTPKLVETVPEARAAVRQLIRDLRRHGGFLAIDTETYPEPEFEEPAYVELNATGALSGRPQGKDKTKKPPALDPHRARIRLLQAYGGGRFVFLFRHAALELLAHSHWLRRQKVVFHGATFDLGMLRAFPPPRLPTRRRSMGAFHCSMQAAGLVLGLGEFEGRNERGLKDVAWKLFGLTMPKDLATSCWVAERLTVGQVAYACCDVAITWKAWKVLYPAMQQEGRMNAYRLQRNVTQAVVRMERTGMPFDPEEHAIQSEKWAREYAEAAHEFKEETGRPPPISQPQIREYLQQILTPAEQDAWPKTPKAGMLKSGEDDLRKLVGRFPSIRSLLVVQAKHTLQKTFGAGLLEFVNPVTGRLHCSFNIASSKAGRFTASKPNLQQLPSNKAPEFRRCISAEDGYVLVGCDLSNIEVRAFAWVTKDETLTQIYREKRDLHTEVAASVLGVPLEQAKQMRHLAKAVVFGAIYGASGRRIAQTVYTDFGVPWSEEDGAEALEIFFSTYAPKGRIWRSRHHDLCQQYGYVYIGAGRIVRKEWEYGGVLSFPQCCNLPIQGIAADCMLRAVKLAHDSLTRARIRGGLIGTIHDELLAEVTEEDAVQARDLIQQAMIEAFEATFPGAPSDGVAKAKIGQTWADLK